MKILHTSDWHLGITLNSASMADEQKNFIDQICEIAKSEGIGAVVIAGDIYDTSVSSSDAVSLFSYATDRLCNELGLKVLVVAGNHDGAARLSAYSSITDKAGLFIRGRLTKDAQPVKIDGVNFFLFPYFNTDEVKSLFPDRDIKNYTDAFKTVCENIDENISETEKNIAVVHTFITGAETGDTDRAAIVGTCANVSASVFEKFDYVCAGHIHRAQDIGKNIRYSGTPMRMSFSECSQEKTVTVYDTDTGERKEIKVKPLFDMKILSGSIEELTRDAEPCDDYIKIELEKGFAGLEQQQFFREFYPNLIMITTKGTDDTIEDITLDMSDIDTLSPKEMCQSYFTEVLGISPEKRQVDMLLDALLEIENEREGETK